MQQQEVSLAKKLPWRTFANFHHMVEIELKEGVRMNFSIRVRVSTRSCNNLRKRHREYHRHCE